MAARRKKAKPTTPTVPRVPGVNEFTVTYQWVSGETRPRIVAVSLPRVLVREWWEPRSIERLCPQFANVIDARCLAARIRLDGIRCTVVHVRRYRVVRG